MDHDLAARRLEEERQRLGDLRSSFESEHLQTESEQENLSELSGADQHQADVGTETFDRERDLSILEQIEAELSDVEHALERLENGTYGLCEACGRPINDARLEALPASRFCVDDQAAAERETRPSGA
ncbi:MAG TPA: TraR/DksA C4-type zinc finger protein [Acidimicrobiales bacterium]|nr:TraR/DksA C4-type zinc finger protein [Acidimicrobiales bacterium]